MRYCGGLILLTQAVFHSIQQMDAVQVIWGGHRQGHDISDGFMEARIGPITEGYGQVFVLQEILHVAHFMVSCDQIIHIHNSALFNPEAREKGGAQMRQGKGTVPICS